MSESITTYTGMFRGNDISPKAATDVQALLVSVEGSLETVTAAVTAAETASAAALATATATAAAAATAQANLASTAATAEATLTASAATVTALVGTVTGSAAAAGASATAAAGSQSTASAAAVTAATSASAAASSATAAGTSQTVAVAAATGASGNASAAASSATAAATSATAALASAAASAASVVQAGANVGRNLIHNSMFNIAQRGVGPFTASGYTLDRWALGTAHVGGGVGSVTQGANTVAVSDMIGDEEAENAVNLSFSGGTAAGDFDTFSQNVEDVRRLSGKTVTVSFWAAAGAGTPKIGLELVQNFGAGGSPSPSVLGIGSRAIQLSTTWTRYTATIPIPAVTGKTLGTSGGHYTALNLWLSAGSTNSASRAGGIGVQAASVFLWGVQLEIGTTATVLEKPDPAQELALCQRFYQFSGGTVSGYAAAAGQTLNTTISLMGSMRANPTTTVTPSGGFNYSGVAITGSLSAIVLAAVSSATGLLGYNFTFTASADL